MKAGGAPVCLHDRGVTTGMWSRVARRLPFPGVALILALAGCMTPPGMTWEQGARQQERYCAERGGTWDGVRCR